MTNEKTNNKKNRWLITVISLESHLNLHMDPHDHQHFYNLIHHRRNPVA